MYIVAYDITDAGRLRRISRILNRYGRRVQKSVYECAIDRTRYQELWDQLKKVCSDQDQICGYQILRCTGKIYVKK